MLDWSAWWPIRASVLLLAGARGGESDGIRGGGSLSALAGRGRSGAEVALAPCLRFRAVKQRVAMWPTFPHSGQALSFTGQAGLVCSQLPQQRHWPDWTGAQLSLSPAGRVGTSVAAGGASAPAGRVGTSVAAGGASAPPSLGSRIGEGVRRLADWGDMELSSSICRGAGIRLHDQSA